jgi:hypothetical protein
MLADIAHGQLTGADISFLVALILFLIGGVIAYTVKALWATVVAVGLAAVALGLMLL